MRAITENIVRAWRNGETKTIDNSWTDGETLFLHNNAIARKVGTRIEIRSAGWETSTTKERLNGICGVSVCQSKFQWYLNDRIWLDSGVWTDLILWDEGTMGASVTLKNIEGDYSDQDSDHVMSREDVVITHKVIPYDRTPKR